MATGPPFATINGMKTRTIITVAIAGVALVYMSRRLSQPTGAPGISDDGALFPKYPDAPPSFYPGSRFHSFAEGRGTDPRYC